MLFTTIYYSSWIKTGPVAAFEGRWSVLTNVRSSLFWFCLHEMMIFICVSVWWDVLILDRSHLWPHKDKTPVRSLNLRGTSPAYWRSWPETTWIYEEIRLPFASCWKKKAGHGYFQHVALFSLCFQRDTTVVQEMTRSLVSSWFDLTSEF